MNFNAYCIECLVSGQAKLAATQNDEAKALCYMKDVLREILNAPENVAAPYLLSRFEELFERYYYPGDRYLEIKEKSNSYALEKEPLVGKIVQNAADPLLAGLKFARLGNYLDFAALRCVDMAVFDELIAHGLDEPLDREEYSHFRRDLAGARKLLYITDNAGEIVFDRVFIEVLQTAFPKLDICVGVRGKPIVNDATRKDAEEAGLAELVRIVDNGTSISGTQIQYLSPEMKSELFSADVILAKGQGNFETLQGCGLNVYYVFLCKCDWFVKLFNVPQLTGMFMNEKRLSLQA